MRPSATLAAIALAALGLAAAAPAQDTGTTAGSGTAVEAPEAGAAAACPFGMSPEDCRRLGGADGMRGHRMGPRDGTGLGMGRRMAPGAGAEDGDETGGGGMGMGMAGDMGRGSHRGMRHHRSGPTLAISTERPGFKLDFECNAPMAQCIEAIERVYETSGRHQRGAAPQ